MTQDAELLSELQLEYLDDLTVDGLEELLDIVQANIDARNDSQIT